MYEKPMLIVLPKTPKNKVEVSAKSGGNGSTGGGRPGMGRCKITYIEK